MPKSIENSNSKTGEQTLTPSPNGPANSMNKPAVCHLLNNAGMGGAQNLVVFLSNLHARDGGSSHVIVMKGPGALSPRFNSHVHLHYLNYERSSIKSPFRFILSLIKGYRLLSNLIKKEKIQVLQTHLPDTNLWGLVLHLTNQCQTIITVHSNQFLSGKFGTKFGKWTTYNAYRLMARSCGAMIAVSNKVKESLAEQLNLSQHISQNIQSIDNGIPIPTALDSKSQLATRGSFSVSQNTTWIIAAGRLAEPKNFSCLIRCAAWLKERKIDVKILIAGEGPLRSELEALSADLDVKDIVNMPGNLDNLQEIMLSADIFAIPSLWEGLPLVLIEAMASGLPVAGSRVRGIEDVINHGENGFLSQVSDHQDLGETILQLIENKELRTTMGASGKSIAQEKYDIEDTYRQYFKIYCQLGK